MNFANMNPAERMKASGLIGLIVVILFFVVHTMMGAVSPKPGNAPGATTSATGGNSGAVAAAATPAQPAAVVPFPTPTPSGKRPGGEAGLALDVHDPFVPLEGTNDKGARRFGDSIETARASAPKVVVQPVESHAPESRHGPEFTSFARGSNSIGSLPPLGGGVLPPFSTALQPAAEPVDPEIRVIGIVHGDPSVATVEVGGRTRIARPGDPLARGWRMLSVDAEGIRVRHGGETISLRVGVVINEPRARTKE